jgi:hypothetical protein
MSSHSAPLISPLFPARVALRKCGTSRVLMCYMWCCGHSEASITHTMNAACLSNRLQLNNNIKQNRSTHNTTQVPNQKPQNPHTSKLKPQTAKVSHEPPSAQQQKTLIKTNHVRAIKQTHTHVAHTHPTHAQTRMHTCAPNNSCACAHRLQSAKLGRRCTRHRICPRHQLCARASARWSATIFVV